MSPNQKLSVQVELNHGIAVRMMNGTRLLDGIISKYTVLARRSGQEWFIGAITNQQGRNLRIPTGFLEPGKYHIEMISDGVNANARAEDYKRVESDFTSGEILNLELAPGGGWVARITPVDKI